MWFVVRPLAFHLKKHPSKTKRHAEHGLSSSSDFQTFPVTLPNF